MTTQLTMTNAQNRLRRMTAQLTRTNVQNKLAHTFSTRVLAPTEANDPRLVSEIVDMINASYYYSLLETWQRKVLGADVPRTDVAEVQTIISKGEMYAATHIEDNAIACVFRVFEVDEKSKIAEMGMVACVKKYQKTGVFTLLSNWAIDRVKNVYSRIQSVSVAHAHYTSQYKTTMRQGLQYQDFKVEKCIPLAEAGAYICCSTPMLKNDYFRRLYAEKVAHSGLVVIVMQFAPFLIPAFATKTRRSPKHNTTTGAIRVEPLSKL